MTARILPRTAASPRVSEYGISEYSMTLVKG
jgi:hypothetical protein